MDAVERVVVWVAWCPADTGAVRLWVVFTLPAAVRARATSHRTHTGPGQGQGRSRSRQSRHWGVSNRGALLLEWSTTTFRLERSSVGRRKRSNGNNNGHTHYHLLVLPSCIRTCTRTWSVGATVALFWSTRMYWGRASIQRRPCVHKERHKCDATVLKRFFRDNFVNFRRRLKRIAFLELVNFSTCVCVTYISTV